MSAEDVKEHVDRALEAAATGNVDADDVEEILDDAYERLEALRVVRGEA